MPARCDLEGEAIAWHPFEVLTPTVHVPRVVFREITKKGIAEGIDLAIAGQVGTTGGCLDTVI